MKKCWNLWLCALLLTCLLALTPAALMEEALPEATEPEAPVEEQVVELGENQEPELTDDAAPAEIESDAVEAALAQGEDIPIVEEYFPDAAFRDYILTIIDNNEDEYLDQGEIDATNSIFLNVEDNDIQKQGMTQELADYVRQRFTNTIASIEGIEYFTNLQYLYAFDMPNLEEIDVHCNNRLKILKAWNAFAMSFFTR